MSSYRTSEPYATRVLPADSAAIAEAARVLSEGGRVAFPTETVYGLGADATDAHAVAQLFESKARPFFNPLIAHLANAEAARHVGRLNEAAALLAERFWPGPLTLVVHAAAKCPVCELARAGLSTVAIRVPSHPVARRLLAAFGKPVVAPSANRSGHVSPTTADHVLTDLRGRIDLVLDGGPAPLGLESTIVDCTREAPRLLRPGAIPRDALEQALGAKLADARKVSVKTPSAPGQLASHYATHARLRLDATVVQPGEALLAFGPERPAGAERALHVLNLSPAGDPVEAAANLFAYLRALDATEAGTIAVAPIPATGLGEAIRDRLARAAAPRTQAAMPQPKPAMSQPQPAMPQAQPAKEREKKQSAPKPAVVTLWDRFAAIVGEKYALRDAADLEPFLHERRDLYQGRASMVLKPGTTQEVSEILKLANETKTPVVPQGGNTGLSGGQVPMDERAIVVSTARLDKIREIDLATNSMTCEAGVILQRAQEKAKENDRLFPLSLGAEGSCMIGGNLSTNAGGTNALTYGVARDLVLGLEIVLADGRIWNGLRKLKKDNTGYDLRHLFIGAEGTLGIITAGVLKLFPAPRSVETAFAGLASPQAALELLQIAQASAGTNVTSFELMTRMGIEFAVQHPPGARDPLAAPHPWYVLLELSSTSNAGLRSSMEEILNAGVERGLVRDATIAASTEQAKHFWHLRLILPDAQRATGASIAHDVSVPVAAVPAFIEEATIAVTTLIPGVRPLPFGHLGDGNIHFAVCKPEALDRDAFLARMDEVNAVVHAVVAKHHGSISAEHGIGLMKRKLLPGVKDPVELELMRSLKQMLDPNGILNPGKVL